jgi:hypothetical protein
MLFKLLLPAHLKRLLAEMEPFTPEERSTLTRRIQGSTRLQNHSCSLFI